MASARCRPDPRYSLLLLGVTIVVSLFGPHLHPFKPPTFQSCPPNLDGGNHVLAIVFLSRQMLRPQKTQIQRHFRASKIGMIGTFTVYYQKVHADFVRACISFLRCFKAFGTPTRKILVFSGMLPLKLCEFVSRSDLVLISFWMLTMPWIFYPISFDRRVSSLVTSL